MSIISRGDTVQVVNNLTVAANATVESLTVGSTATIANNLTVNSLTVGSTATIANNLTANNLYVGSTATIGTSMLVGAGGVTFQNATLGYLPAPLTYNENTVVIGGALTGTNAGGIVLYFSRIGRRVLMTWDRVTWTTNSGPGTVQTNGSIPSRFRPLRDTSCNYGMRNSGTDSVSLMFVTTAGNISWRINTSFGPTWSVPGSNFIIYEGGISWDSA